jgi:alcohol dehydrogenase (cytochrome c)
MTTLLLAVLLAQHTPENDRNPLAGNPNAIAAGAKLYAQTCQTCHGSGRAAVVVGRVLTHGAKDGEIFLNIRNGIRGTQMPAFSALTTEQAWQLVSFIRSDGSAAPETTVVRSGGLTFEQIRDARSSPQNWYSYWGDYKGTHYSPLAKINASNVRTLQAQWAVQMVGDSIVESTPLVIDGVMYTAGPPGEVYALDARTGSRIWKYQRTQKTVNPYESNRVNRGVAVLGNRVFFGTLDAALVALDAKTGTPLWETQVADTMEGYSITAAPLALNDKIIVGIAGGEYGIRGFLDAYDPATGKRLWRFNSVPGPGESGNDTWKGDSWKRGGGGTWLTGSYDPELDLLYWGVGNPGPDIDGEIRRGDNLFTCSVVALDPSTGQRKWHFQFTPNDTHDWDSNEDMVLVDRVIAGQPRKLLLHADRNGFLYTLDRSNGKFISATPFVRQTWNKGFDANGRPLLNDGVESSPDGSIPVFPDLAGGTNFQPPSYSPLTGWLYLAYREGGHRFFRNPAAYEAGKLYWSGSVKGVEDPGSAGIRAINPVSGKIEWDFPLLSGSLSNGVLATAGGVLFAGSQEGNLIALDARTGKFLWRFPTGAAMAAAPMSYAIDGRQYIAVSAGNVLYSFALAY